MNAQRLDRFLKRRLAWAATAVLVLLLFWPAGEAKAQSAGQQDGIPQPGSYYALVIGINQYSAPLPALKTAVGDAEAMAKVLSEQYGFKVQLLTDSNATRDNIVGALDKYRRTLEAKDSLLIYYAGHGYQDKEEDKAYWIPVDASRSTTSHWIIADEITTNMRADPARHVLIISDSCYSGALTRDAGIEARPADINNYLSKMVVGRSRTLMSSGGDEPVADGGGGDHSVFANSVLRALSGTDAKEFTAADLFHDYVLRQVAGNAEQVPRYSSVRNSGDDNGDFVFLKSGVKGSVERIGGAAAVSASTGAAAGSDRGTERSPAGPGMGAPSGAGSGAARETAEKARALFEQKHFMEARPFARVAAMEGDAEGENLLGMMFARGEGAPKDPAEALRWFRQSADQGYAKGEDNLGRQYELGEGLQHKGPMRAVEWYRKAAEQGDAGGEDNLGKAYLSGHGVTADQAQALMLFRKSAAQGFRDGQFDLGRMYEAGNGVPKNLATALYWYEKAAAQEGGPGIATESRDRLKAAGVVAAGP